MNNQIRSLSHRRRIGGDYKDLILGTGPIAYWPLDETGGAVAGCLVNPAQNGAYTGVTLADDASGPFGTPAPFFDGTNDCVDIYSAALAAAWSGTELTWLIWCRVANVGVWSDATNRYPLRLAADANNYTLMRRVSGANNTIAFNFAGGGTLDTASKAGLTTTDWFLIGMTVSDSGDRIDYWFDGVSFANDTGVGTWVGALAAGSCVLGAYSLAPASPWHGWLGQVILWDRVLPQATITAIANP